MLRKAALLSLALTAAGFVNPAFAQSWSICNKTSGSVDVTVGYAIDGGLLQSKGWFVLAPNGGCAHVINRSDTVDYTTGYLYARTSGSRNPVIAGDQNLCVNNDAAFAYHRHDNCGVGNLQHVQSRPIGFDLNKNWTTNITGGPSSGHRID
jgi:uncharacterized membrane protein